MTEGVLLIHAFPLDARMWESQVTSLSPEIPVVAPHLPGFGGTPDAGRVMAMGAAADRCLQAADAAGVDRMVVCGLSMGGYVAFELWRMARGRIAGLILANTKAERDTPEAASGRRTLADRLDAEGSGFLVASPPPLLGETAPDDLRALVRDLIADQPAGSIAAAARGMAERKDSGPDLSAIDVPALVITSDGDALIPPEVTAPMAERIPGAELVTIRGAGHLSNLEAPDAFEAALRPFLGRCGLPVRPSARP
jgi:pimeloyl-ACP methyl ester carboxylesterase